MRAILLLLMSLLVLPVSALSNEAISAAREPGVSWVHYLLSAGPGDRNPVGEVTTPNPTVSNAARPYNEAVLPEAPIWDSPVQLQEVFERVRDERFLATPQTPTVYRRSTWLFPDDGCYARASLAINNIVRWNFAAPKKVFVFGNLNARTPNTRSGRVTWWYHVAPIVTVQNQKYVLDPAINPNHPLPLREWLGTMSTDASTLRVSICGSGAYSPFDLCDQTSDQSTPLALRDQYSFLERERERITSLGRNADQELGDQPPWRSRP